MKPTTKHIARIIFALFMLAACPHIALAEDNAPPFMKVGKMYRTYDTAGSRDSPMTFKVLDLGKDGWVKIQLESSFTYDSEKTPMPLNRFKIWFNTKAVLLIIELEEPKKN